MTFDPSVIEPASRMLVKLKAAGLTMPVTVALTVNAPVVAFALMVIEAMPFASVVAVPVVEEPLNVPDALDPGAVNVTVKPAMPTPDPSLTTTLNCVA